MTEPDEAATAPVPEAFDYEMSQVEATRLAVSTATHLKDGRFAGTIAALFKLARKIDAWDQIVEYAIEDMQGRGRGGRPVVPQNDNVSLASYAKLSEQLGLTPSGRRALDQPLRGVSTPTKASEKTGADPLPQGGASGASQRSKVTDLQGFRSAAAGPR